MNTVDIVTSRLRQEPQPVEAREALAWLESHAVSPVAAEPARITVAEASRLWNTRLKTVGKQRSLPELADLVGRLKNLTPRRKIDQFGFRNESWAAAFLFEHTGGALYRFRDREKDLIHSHPTKRHSLPLGRLSIVSALPCDGGSSSPPSSV